MALINCSECGKQISDKAATCPGCGAPVTAQAQPSPQQGGTAPGTAPGAPGDLHDPGDSAAELRSQAGGKTKLLIGLGAAGAVVLGVVLVFVLGGSAKKLPPMEACTKLGLNNCRALTPLIVDGRLGTAEVHINGYETEDKFWEGKTYWYGACEGAPIREGRRCDMYVNQKQFLVVSVYAQEDDKETRKRIGGAVPKL